MPDTDTFASLGSTLAGTPSEPPAAVPAPASANQPAQAVPPAAAPPAVVPPAAQQPPATPGPEQHQDRADSFLGRAVRSLMGKQYDYQVDPATGKTQAVPIPQKPGDLFRHLLMGALIGGAAGGAAHDFASGLGRGGAAVSAEETSEDERRRAHAQQQFTNQQAASEAALRQAAEEREQQAARTSETLKRAQIAQVNAETYRTNALTAGESFATHERVATAGRVHFADYAAGGLQPVFRDIPEQELTALLKKRPEVSTLDWEATGVRAHLDAQGHPTYSYTYSAYNPTGDVPVSRATLAQWKKDGLDTVYPELFSIVKPGGTIKATAYLELKRLDSQLFNDQLERTKKGLDVEKTKASIAEANATAAYHLAAAAHSRAEATKIATEKKQNQMLGDALDELTKAGGHFDRLTPRSQFVIGQSAQKMAGDALAEAKLIFTQDPDDKEGKGKALIQEADGWRQLAGQAIRADTKTQATVVPPQLMSFLKTLPPSELEAELAKSKQLTPAQKNEIRRQLETHSSPGAVAPITPAAQQPEPRTSPFSVQ